MPIKSYKVGPGVLAIGATGSPVDFTAQITKAVLKWAVKAEDSKPTLSGEELPGDRTYTASLTATLIQELTEDGLIDYSWANKGSTVPFAYTPSTAEGRSITGQLIVDPIDVGGDAKTRPTSDIEWGCVGEPVLGTDLA